MTFSLPSPFLLLKLPISILDKILEIPSLRSEGSSQSENSLLCILCSGKGMDRGKRKITQTIWTPGIHRDKTNLSTQGFPSLMGGASGPDGLLLSQNVSTLQVDASASQINLQIKLTYQYKVFRHSWAVHQDRRHFYHHTTSLRDKLSRQQRDNSGPWWWYKYSFYSRASCSHR